MKKPILCYVTDRKLFSADSCADRTNLLLEHIEQAARAGVDWIQLREKDLEGGPFFELVARASQICSTAANSAEKHARIIVNDRLDVAWAAHAAGVHAGENSVPLAEIVRWRTQAGRPEFLVGVSCHSLEAATQAAAGGANYIFFGPIFATPSKQAFGPPQGMEKLQQVCQAVSVPVLAIGGITPENAGACLHAGAAGIAAIRLFQEAPELAAALRQIRA